MSTTLEKTLAAELAQLREARQYKQANEIQAPQAPHTRMDGKPVINLSSNNYLALANHPRVVEAGKRAIDKFGLGTASVRFICGTMSCHVELERKIRDFLGCEAATTYISCWDANVGVMPTLCPTPDDAIFSDALNHASIIDGIRLCKAERLRYPNGDMAALEEALKQAAGRRLRMIATDGVFSMDGYLAKLDRICDLAERYDALVMVDDSHATGFIGPTGRGTPEHFGVLSRVDVLTSTLGKALGGASGGFTTGRQEIVELLRQRSRPYLFSNTLAPAVAGASLAVFDLLDQSAELRERVMGNAARFRKGMLAAGFQIKEGIHPIVPVMIGDAKLAQDMAARLLEEGIYVIGFSYPVVPKGEARIRVQLSAQHEPAHVDQAIAAFTKVGRAMGVVG